MTRRLEALGGWPGVRERSIRRDDVSGDEAAAAVAPAVPRRSAGFETVTVTVTVTVAVEQPPAT